LYPLLLGMEGYPTALCRDPQTLFLIRKGCMGGPEQADLVVSCDWPPLPCEEEGELKIANPHNPHEVCSPVRETKVRSGFNCMIHKLQNVGASPGGTVPTTVLISVQKSKHLLVQRKPRIMSRGPRQDLCATRPAPIDWRHDRPSHGASGSGTAARRWRPALGARFTILCNRACHLLSGLINRKSSHLCGAPPTTPPSAWLWLWWLRVNLSQGHHTCCYRSLAPLEGRGRHASPSLIPLELPPTSVGVGCGSCRLLRCDRGGQLAALSRSVCPVVGRGPRLAGWNTTSDGVLHRLGS
jgi:hypothetical protein